MLLVLPDWTEVGQAGSRLSGACEAPKPKGILLLGDMMSYLWVGFYVLVGYGAFVLLAEFLIWRFQPEMDGGVTL